MTDTPQPSSDLVMGVGRPGGIACVPMSLVSGGVAISATTNDIGFSTSELAFIGCTINPAIGSGTAANKQLAEVSLNAGLERISVLGNSSVTIPDGLTYTCEFRIDPSLVPGAAAVANSASASDPSGQPVNVSGASTSVVVTNCIADCNGNGTVTIGEVTRCINLFLGEPLCNLGNSARSCPVADVNNNGVVSIGEVTQCVNQFLHGCQ